MKKTQKRFNAGLIGFGYWGPVLLRNFHNSGHFKVLKVCDHNPQKLNKVSDVSAGIEVTQEQNDILNDDSIDLVIVATQAKSHYGLIREALIHDKHVFVEKPFVLSLKEAQDLIGLNRKKRLKIMVDHTYLFSQHYKKFKETARSNKLGRLLHFHSTRSDFGLFQKDASIIWHLLYHDAYMLLDLFPMKIKEIRSSGYSHIIDKIEDTAYVSIKYENGMSAEILVNMLFPVKERKIALAGDKKIIYWNDCEEDKLRIYNKCAAFDGNTRRVKYNSNIIMEKLKVSGSQPLENEIDYFAYCLQNDIAPLNNEHSACDVVALLDSIEKTLHNKDC